MNIRKYDLAIELEMTGKYQLKPVPFNFFVSEKEMIEKNMKFKEEKKKFARN